MPRDEERKVMTPSEQKRAAARFARQWQGRGYEKGQSQTFWLSLLHDVLGVEHPDRFITFEDQVHLDHTSFIDGFIPATHVLIEQKSIGKNLRDPIVQSDGSRLTPFQQAKRYAAELPYSERPRWIVTCNFGEWLVYDMERPNDEPASILLADLERDYYRLLFLVDSGNHHLQREMQVSLQAGELVGRLYDALISQYADPTSPHALQSLNALCVRIVFCLYAEDAGLFASRTAFHDYLCSFKPENVRKGLIDLFKTLDTPPERRDPYDEPNLLAFPYVNGGLFSDESLEIPRLTPEIITLIAQDCSADFDWSEISPTIFGAVFESTLNPETRRSGGMHYTSIENIHKVIDPLFLNDLNDRLSDIAALTQPNVRRRRLQEFQAHLGSLTFLDPACGSGNFLTETYLSLRRLENRVIKLLRGDGQIVIGGGFSPIRVSIHQFYGIEINDFAVTVAKTALWISECQMMQETESIVAADIDFLPLKTYSNITQGNALRLDWNDIVPKHRLNYIIGNPPFVGARMKSKEQADDMMGIFGAKWKNLGNMDYVCGWYKKAANMMQGTDVACAFVSTNSITQGEQVANLWQPLMRQGIVIHFAHRTFRWDSEATLKAHVHCVIVGFHSEPSPADEGASRFVSMAGRKKVIFDGEQTIQAKHINAYLLDGPDVFVGSRQHPMCDVPEIGIGNKPIDGGNYLFTREEMEAFIKLEPKSESYFHPWYGSEEFIHQKPRYCLWLGDCTPAELHSMPHCLKRVAAVREARLASKSAGTRKLAERPTRFHVENMPKSNYIIIPRVSSERRKYVPMGFLTPDNLTSDSAHIIPDATLYHFGVLTSNVHMAWMRTVCGRLKSDYRYSKDVVYNNFPWPEVTNEQRERIAQTAQGILDARALYPDSSLADLYDEVTMPPELRRAHQQNDRAVMAAYGFPVKDFTQDDCVSRLMEMYYRLVSLQG